MNLKNFSKRLDERGANVWVAVSIIIAGLLVAGAVIFTVGNGSDFDIDQPGQDVGSQDQADPSSISPVTEDDHIRGDINAPIKIVEFSDIECPFCARLHVTFKDLADEFPDEVAFVYRHLPIVQARPKALTQALATECAAEQGGNDAFWAFLDQLYSETPGGNRFNLDRLPEIAEEQGLDVDEFNECVDSQRFLSRVQSQINEGFAAGAEGTPYSIIITPEGNYLPVSGAQPIEVWRQIINDILDNEL